MFHKNSHWQETTNVEKVEVYTWSETVKSFMSGRGEVKNLDVFKLWIEE